LLIKSIKRKREEIKAGKYFAKCLSTRHIKAAVSTAEREITGDIAKNKIDVVLFYFFVTNMLALGELLEKKQNQSEAKYGTIKIFCFVGGVSYLDCGKNRTKTPKHWVCTRNDDFF
jgi:hypothetical protein